jgi:hypothetical protein
VCKDAIGFRREEGNDTGMALQSKVAVRDERKGRTPRRLGAAWWHSSTRAPGYGAASSAAICAWLEQTILQS